ncbi:hypothetical protein GW17_00018725 [Ensete ventricosum]|nr:hypothetical protein GW17_00018725 [Ensete ventricosum]
MIDTKSESFSSKIEKIFGLEVGLDRKETDEQLRRAIAAEKEREERERGSRIQFLANLKQMAALSNKSAASSYLLQKIPQPPSVFSAFRSNSSPFAVWSAIKVGTPQLQMHASLQGQQAWWVGTAVSAHGPEPANACSANLEAGRIY